jgi:hypothetical protein
MAKPETVDVEVVNPNGLKAVLPQAFTFTPVEGAIIAGTETASGAAGKVNPVPAGE